MWNKFSKKVLSYILHSDTFSQNSAMRILYLLKWQLLEEFVNVTSEI